MIQLPGLAFFQQTVMTKHCEAATALEIAICMRQLFPMYRNGAYEEPSDELSSLAALGTEANATLLTSFHQCTNNNLHQYRRNMLSGTPRPLHRDIAYKLVRLTLVVCPNSGCKK